MSNSFGFGGTNATLVLKRWKASKTLMSVIENAPTGSGRFYLCLPASKGRPPTGSKPSACGERMDLNPWHRHCLNLGATLPENSPGHFVGYLFWQCIQKRPEPVHLLPGLPKRPTTSDPSMNGSGYRSTNATQALRGTPLSSSR